MNPLVVGQSRTPGRPKAPFTLPPSIITQTLAILAVKRAGKSNAAVVIAEEMFRAGLPWVAVDPKGDWWGIRAGQDGGPGLAVLVLGGDHGDVPLEPSSGRVVAEFIVEQRVTCVLDVSGFSKSMQRKFLKDFAERLYRINTEPLMVFCEEADEYIPQRVMTEMAELVGAFEMLVKRGGFKGIGICLITQRSASLNKDVLTQIETLIVLRTPSPQDRKAILGWVETHAVGKEAVDQLPGLANGEAWVFSPQWLNLPGAKMQFRQRSTFDSGRTPEIGSTRAPAVLADVDVTALQRAMAATIDRARQEDPRELQKAIVDLTRQLAEARGQQREVRVFTDADHLLLAAIQNAIDAYREGQEAMRALASRIEEALIRARMPGVPRDVAIHTTRAPIVERTITVGGSPSAVDVRSEVPVSPPPKREQNGKSGQPAGVPGEREQRLLDAIGWWWDIGIPAPTRIQISLIAAFGIGGSFNGALAILQQAELVKYPGSGQVRLTPEGEKRARRMGIAPTQEAFLERIFAKLHAHDVAILKVLLDGANATPMSRDELSSLTGHRVGGTFNHALSRLQKLGLVEYPGPGLVRPTDVLFPFNAPNLTRS